MSVISRNHLTSFEAKARDLAIPLSHCFFYLSWVGCNGLQSLQCGRQAQQANRNLIRLDVLQALHLNPEPTHRQNAITETRVIWAGNWPHWSTVAHAMGPGQIEALPTIFRTRKCQSFRKRNQASCTPEACLCMRISKQISEMKKIEICHFNVMCFI